MGSKPERKKRGRPVVRPFPDPIPDTPENIARIALTTPPKKKAVTKVLMGKKKKGIGAPSVLQEELQESP